MKNALPVCYISDENYYLPTVVSISSLLEAREPSTRYEVFLITNFEIGDQVEMLDELRKNHPDCVITCLQSPEMADSIVTEKKNHVSPIALLKYNLCTLIPHFDKAIYIDGDTIVQKDLSELYNVDLGENLIGAAPALIGYYQKYHNWQYERRVGVPFSEYVNTGVMLMNFAAFRREEIPRKLVDFTRAHRDLMFMDQDAFNAVCKGRVVFLEQRFNLMPGCRGVSSERMRDAAAKPTDAVVLHFAGKTKPWVSLQAPWSRYYVSHLRRSPARKVLLGLFADFGASRLKSAIKRPITRARSYVKSELRLVGQLYRDHDRGERRKDEDAFAAQYFYLDQMNRNTASGLNQTESRDQRIIVSLTTIPPRIYDIGTTIESLLLQSLKPDMIVLWLDKDGLTEEDLPLNLRRQMDRGLTVRFCEDIGPHTKLVPALKEFPEDVIITVDDDILYPSYVLERLYRNYLQDKSKIYCNRARFISVLKHADFSYEQDWENVREEVEGLNVIPLGVGGVLYPPKILHEDVFDLKLQKKLTPKADDIWFKAMSLRRGVLCKRIAGLRQIYPIRPHSQEVSLHSENVFGGGNEAQVQACFNHFHLWELLGADHLA